MFRFLEIVHACNEAELSRSLAVIVLILCYFKRKLTC